MGKAPVARLGMQPPAAAAARASLPRRAVAKAAPARPGRAFPAAAADLAATPAALAPRAAPSFGPAPRRPARRVAS